MQQQSQSKALVPSCDCLTSGDRPKDLLCNSVATSVATTEHPRHESRGTFHLPKECDPGEDTLPEEFVNDGGLLNQEAVNYRPLTFRVARGKAKIEHPTHARPKKLFNRIKIVYLKPSPKKFWTPAQTGPMRDPGANMDEIMDDDAGDSKLGEEEDAQAEEGEEESDTQAHDSMVGFEDHSLDRLPRTLRTSSSEKIFSSSKTSPLSLGIWVGRC